MDVAYLFSALAGVTALIAYAFLMKQIVKGQSTPNPSSWAIWLIVGIINTATYFVIVHNNPWQSFIAVAVTFSVLIVFLYSATKGKFTKVTKLEIVIFVLSVLIGIFWQLSSDARTANLFLQGIYIIAYIPTYSGLLSGRARENPVSWTLAVIAYSFSILSLELNSPGDWVAFLFPLVNGVIGNGLVILITIKKQGFEALKVF